MTTPDETRKLLADAALNLEQLALTVKAAVVYDHASLIDWPETKQYVIEIIDQLAEASGVDVEKMTP